VLYLIRHVKMSSMSPDMSSEAIQDYDNFREVSVDVESYW